MPPASEGADGHPTQQARPTQAGVGGGNGFGEHDDPRLERRRGSRAGRGHGFAPTAGSGGPHATVRSKPWP
jgi:hypothetical protein